MSQSDFFNHKFKPNAVFNTLNNETIKFLFHSIGLAQEYPLFAVVF